MREKQKKLTKCLGLLLNRALLFKGLVLDAMGLAFDVDEFKHFSSSSLILIN